VGTSKLERGCGIKASHLPGKPRMTNTEINEVKRRTQYPAQSRGGRVNQWRAHLPFLKEKPLDAELNGQLRGVEEI